jgi:hypothetical protein
MTAVVFDATAFRAQNPAYADPTAYPDATLQQYWNNATNYISDANSGVLGALVDAQLQFAINLMTAHLLFLSGLVLRGVSPGFVTQSTIDKISVSLQAPPEKNQWQWWLNLSPYGQQLLAMLQARSAGGFYIGGLPELGAFRKVGGTFC